ncbi:hypothetical protein CEXT_647841 [Caerostris extrusa]|uniref:Uncharacterized protein n=1 Tax=Caerostris extrusa TaxID=172846 RepID=A0AAV4RG05_CAEEX|nr:hypothetical protein CEXT_647841 [Caerostris extrusa]
MYRRWMGVESGRSLTGRYDLGLPKSKVIYRCFDSTLGFLECLHVEISVVVFTGKEKETRLKTAYQDVFEILK